MFNLLHVIDLGKAASADAADQMVHLLTDECASLPGVVSAKAGKTLPRALNGGHVMWRLGFLSEQDYWNCQASSPWRSKIIPALAPFEGVFIDSVAYRADQSDVSAGRSREGIWRCLVLAVDTKAPYEHVRQFEQDMLLMPKYVPSIRNWALGHVVSSQGRRRWTHVWEQEFDDITGLERDYMAHPIHWGLVDGWYDPECPQRIVDTLCIQGAFAIDEALIG
jgi:hypothetical protein